MREQGKARGSSFVPSRLIDGSQYLCRTPASLEAHKRGVLGVGREEEKWAETSRLYVVSQL